MDATIETVVEGPSGETESTSRERIGDLSTDRLDAEIGELAAHIAAATAGFLLLVAEFDHRAAYEDQGFGDCARWLSWRCSLSPRSAREHVRVARALRERPRIAEAFLHGEITYSKARALTRITTDANEETLLSHALHATAAQLERIVRGYRRAQTLAEAEEANTNRRLIYHWEADGSLSFRGRIGPEEGALLLRGLEAGREAAWAKADSEGGHAGPRADNPADASNADALAAMAEMALSSGQGRRSGGDRTQIVVHLDPGRAQLEDGPTLCDEAARRLACDASLVPMGERDGKPLSVGRKTRTIPPALRRALRSRDRGCRFPGCHAHRFTDAHHIRHWADGGETSLGNLVELCRRHHRLLHEGDFTLEADGDARFTFRDKWGKVVPDCPELGRGRPSRLRALNGRRGGPAIDPRTCFPRSAGTPMDLDLTVWGLFRLEEHAKREAGQAVAHSEPVGARAGP